MKKIGSWTWPATANGTGRSGRNWLLSRLARIVRGSERKGTRGGTGSSRRSLHSPQRRPAGPAEAGRVNLMRPPFPIDNHLPDASHW